MEDFGKILITFGVILVVLGLLTVVLSKLNLPLGNLPGDIKLQKDNFTLYIPLGTSIFLSLLLTLAINLILLLFGKR